MRLILPLLAVVPMGTVQATVLPPGTSGLPDLFAPPAGSILLASTGVVHWTNSVGTMSGTFTSEVFKDPNNTFAAGDLDFLYQVSNSAQSTDSIARTTAINFTGFFTDVGFTASGSTLGGPFVDGTVAPELVDRVSANVIGFTFNAPFLNVIGPGQTSNVLIVETNATMFAPGNFNLIDGGVTTLGAFSPSGPGSNSVPEPTSVFFIGCAMLALPLVRRLMAPILSRR
jgi:hypothetical protein